MPRKASPEVVDSLSAYLQRRGGFSADELRARMSDLQAGRLRPPTSSSAVFRPALATSDSTTEASSVPGEVRFPAHALRAEDASADEVQWRIAQFEDFVRAQLRAGELPSVDLPDVHQANAIYDDRGNVFLGAKVRRLSFDGKGCKSFMRILLSMEAAANSLRSGVLTTKRGLYYHHQTQLPDAAARQRDSDRALAALVNILGVRRKALGFVEARRGLVWGRLVIRDGGQVFDLSQGAAALGIPRFADHMEILSSDADFILVVEKHSVAFRLAQLRWWDTARCILVTGEGCPSVSGREFVRSLVDTLGIPAIVCVDADPGGIQVALAYAHGAISMALETPWLACNNIWWAGLHPSDIERCCESPDQIPLEDADLEAAHRLIEHPSEMYVNKRVRAELALLLQRGAKVELDALADNIPRFVDYLHEKVLGSDLIRL